MTEIIQEEDFPTEEEITIEQDFTYDEYVEEQIIIPDYDEDEYEAEE